MEHLNIEVLGISKVLEAIRPESIKILTIICQEIWTRKMAHILEMYIPLPKKGDLPKTSNYGVNTLIFPYK